MLGSCCQGDGWGLKGRLTHSHVVFDTAGDNDVGDLSLGVDELACVSEVLGKGVKGDYMGVSLTFSKLGLT